MQCPVDSTTLVMSDKQGIEIDYCPKCRGVWLDRGELDKIIERTPSSYESPANNARHYDDDDDNYRKPDSHDNRRYESQEYHRGYDEKKKHKKEGFLGDLFDF